MKVAKFGGSSVKDALSMRRCAEIVAKDSSLGLVIISATYNSTNMLEELCAAAGEASKIRSLVDSLADRHSSLANELMLTSLQNEELDGLCEELKSHGDRLSKLNQCGTQEKDLVLSWGEKISSYLFYSLLSNQLSDARKTTWLNACDYVATDSNFGLATPAKERMKERVESSFKEAFDRGELFVTQGFIGRDEDGNITTLGREGSDYSAALFAHALCASEVQIWTDVDGVYQCDPNIVEAAKRIPFMSYAQATTMARSGAKVLFGKTLAPLIEQEIPVFVRSSRVDQSEGTLISGKSFEEQKLLSLAFKKRTDGLIITLIGEDLGDIEIEQSEIDRGEDFRSFFIPSSDLNETLNLWYNRYF